MPRFIKKAIVITFSYFIINDLSYAVEQPSPGKFDERVTHINFNAEDIVKLVGHFGYSTHIRFSPSETILQIAMGDPEAWDIVPVNNHIFIKPTAEQAETNMTVISSKRVYNFELDAKWPEDTNKQNMVFQINFRYPQDTVNKKKATKKQKIAQINKKNINSYLNDNISSFNETLPRNWDYWYKGAEEIRPDLTFDNGRFTYLKFSNNREMPAIYIVNEDNTESLVNTHINPKYPDIIVIHKVKKRFILRKGQSVTCIFNKSFDSKGIGIPTGTTSPKVIRKIKERR